MFPLVSEGKTGRMLAADAGAVRKEDAGHLGEPEQEARSRARVKTVSKRGWVLAVLSWMDTHMEILEGTDNFLYSTDEKTETQSKVGSGQGCQARFGPQLPGGLCHLDMDFGRIASGITVEFRVSRVSLRSRKEENHFVYSPHPQSHYILSTLLYLSRIMPDQVHINRTEWLQMWVIALRKSGLEDSFMTHLLQRFLAISIFPGECFITEVP